MRLAKYKNENDLKQLNIIELKELARGLRAEIYQECARFGTQLGSIMAIVDLTISLLKHFDYQKCRYLFDTGYQAYAFKRLTDWPNFDTLVHDQERYNNFQQIKNGDHYSGGHTSISAGWASGYNWLNEDKTVIEVIGDSALATSIGLGGMLNFATSKHKGLFILNDNKEGIGANQFSYLDWEKIATGMDYEYLEVVNGHDYNELEKAWAFYDKAVKPVFIKVNTIKSLAIDVDNREQKPLNLVSHNSEASLETVSSIEWLAKNFYLNLLKNNPNAMIFISGMLWGYHLVELKTQFPTQIVDAGISEEISIVQAAAAANANKEVYFLLNSSFLQRCYDQIIHDVMRNNINMTTFIFNTDPGEAGNARYGLYDLNIYNGFENIYVYQPASTGDLANILEKINAYKGPKIVRMNGLLANQSAFNKDASQWVYNTNINAKKVIITYGSYYFKLKKYVQANNLDLGIILATSLNPLDDNLLKQLIKADKQLYTYELTFWKNNLASTIRAHYPNLVIQDFSFKNPFVGYWEIEKNMKNAYMDFDYVTKTILQG